jgi:hypothetical protein
VSGVLFAERFLVRPADGPPPQPATYDERRAISLTADGRPFIESGACLETRTLTEAEGEGADDDRDRLAAQATKTSAPGEPVDREPQSSSVKPARPSDPFLDTKTMTFTDAEGADDDRDRHVKAAALHTDTRADGERPDASPWAHTETAAPGEPADYHRWLLLTTVTKAEGERDA